MTTETIINTFKQRARNGERNTFADHIIYSIARAMQYAKSEGEANYLSTKYVLRMVSPLNQHDADCQHNGDRYGKLTFALKQIHNRLQGRLAFLYHIQSDLLGMIPDEECKRYADFAERLIEATERHYVYIFVRQDIIFEQQAVQAAHATMCAGAKMAGKMYNGKHFNPQSTHFVLIGVPDKDALCDAIQLAADNDIFGSIFFEEDMGGEETAFCTDVVSHEQRATFREYGLLKMKQPNTIGRRIGKKIDETVETLYKKATR